MIKWKYVIFGYALFMMISAIAQAEPPNIASIPLRIDFSELDTFWAQAMTFLRNQEFIEANLKFEELNQVKVKMGLQNLPYHAKVLVREASRLKKQNQLGEALKLLDTAQKLAPNSADVSFALAKVRFAQNFTDVYGVARVFWRGLVLTLKDLNTFVVYVNNGLSLLFVTFGLSWVVLLVFSFGYYQRAIFFHLKEILPGSMPLFFAHIIGWVLLGVVTVALGIFWGILCLALLLIFHTDALLKRILQILLGLGILTGLVLIVISITFYVSNGEYFQALRDLTYGHYSGKTVNSFQEHLQSYPDDAYAMFGLAFIAQNTGNVQEAINTYEMITSRFPDRAAVQNNLGNVYQKQFRHTKDRQWYQKAEEAYRAAIFADQDMFEPRYNYGQLLLMEFTSGNAEEQISAARNINQERFTVLSGYLEDNIFNVDAPLSTTTLLQKLYSQQVINEGFGLARRLWGIGSRFTNPWFFSIASGVLFFLALASGGKKKPKKGQVLYCQMCGDPYTVKRKKKDEAPSNFCTQCTYIFKKKTHTDPKKRQKKVQQIQLRQRVRGIIVKVSSLLFPGAGQIYYGYILKGFLIAFLFYGAIALFLLKIYGRVLLETSGGSVSFWLTLILAVLFGIGTYLFNVYDVFKLSPKNQ